MDADKTKLSLGLVGSVSRDSRKFKGSPLDGVLVDMCQVVSIPCYRICLEYFLVAFDLLLSYNIVHLANNPCKVAFVIHIV